MVARGLGGTIKDVYDQLRLLALERHARLQGVALSAEAKGTHARALQPTLDTSAVL